MTIEEKLYALLVPAVVTTLCELTATQATAAPYSVFFSLGQSPLVTQQESLVQGLRTWEFQFSSYATSPSAARAETKRIVDYLTSYSGAGISAVFLKTRRMLWDDDTNLAHSMAELTIWETLG